MNITYNVHPALLISVRCYLYVICVFTFVIFPFYYYAIVYKSTKRMQSYKRILIANMIPSSIITTVITLACPVYDYIGAGFTFHDTFGNFTMMGRIITVMVVLNSLVISSDLLIVMLIDRFHSIVKDLGYSQLYFVIIYVLMGATSLIQCGEFIILLIHEHLSEELATFFRSLVNTFTNFTIAYQFSRIVALITIVFLNDRLGKKLNKTSSRSVEMLHKMLTRAINTVVIFTILISRIPIILALASQYTNNNNIIDYVNTFTACIIQSIFLCDMLITFYFVKPYRYFIVSLFHKDEKVFKLSQTINRN
uniref:G_PROTEIN_RECEP_F1_2 domain-containing protein n=1 Tax=Panagrellus redivivus TaxID=6233 RepID=A0A7E4W7I0_PANRE